MKVLISNWLLNSKISQLETLKLLEVFFFFSLIFNKLLFQVKNPRDSSVSYAAAAFVIQ